MESIDLSNATDSGINVMNSRIARVYETQNNAKSEWAKHYWSTVLAYLLRQANRLN